MTHEIIAMFLTKTCAPLLYPYANINSTQKANGCIHTDRPYSS